MLMASKRAASGAVSASQQQRARIACPHLDTVNRAVLDFDLEKQCSVSVTTKAVYCCLVCGSYFRGRGKNTPCYTHSLQAGHYVFMNLGTSRIYCLPDNYEVVDSSLDDIKYNLRPTFSDGEVAALDDNTTLSQDIFGVSYLPGFVGMNNLRCTDFVNVIVQSLVHVRPLREFFMDRSKYAASKSGVVHAFGELVCKLWSPRKFKGSVSPHELMHAVSTASKKRFQIGTQSEAIEFLSWFLNELHRGLGGTRKSGSSIVHECFQGEVEVVTSVVTAKAASSGGDGGSGAAAAAAAVAAAGGESAAATAAAALAAAVAAEPTTARIPFLFLSLELPAVPLFKDSHDGKTIIPQVPLFDVLKKFDGTTYTDLLRSGRVERKRYRITRLPPFLMFHMKRFTSNNWYVEKNPTIVNFPLHNLELKDYVKPRLGEGSAAGPSPEAVPAMGVSELKKLCAELRVEVRGAVEKRDLVLRAQAAIVRRRAKLHQVTKYDLVANTCHDVPPDKGKEKNMDPLKSGSYRCHVQNRASGQWFEVQDLHVRETMPQLISLSETYLLLFQANDV